MCGIGSGTISGGASDEPCDELNGRKEGNRGANNAGAAARCISIVVVIRNAASMPGDDASVGVEAGVVAAGAVVVLAVSAY